MKLIERVEALKLKKGPKPPKTVRLNHALVAAPSGASLFLKGIGDGVQPVGSECQAQTESSLGPVHIEETFSGGSLQIVACPAGTTILGGGCECGSSEILNNSPSKPGEAFGPGWECECTMNGTRTFAICG